MRSDAKKHSFANCRKKLTEKGFLLEDGEGYRPDEPRKMAIKTKNMLRNAGITE